MTEEVTILGNPVINGVVDDSVDYEIPVPSDLVELALHGETESWDLMCSRLPDYGLMNPIGKLMITHLIVDNEKWEFH